MAANLGGRRERPEVIQLELILQVSFSESGT